MGQATGKSVCIIGGGVSGLVTAKVLKADGFDIAVYEKESKVGGKSAMDCAKAAAP